MDKSISSKLIELNKNFYNNCADDFSTSRNKHYWNLFNYTLEDCKSNFFELEDNNIFIIGNLSSEFLNKDEIKILDLGCGNGRYLEYIMNNEKLKNKKIKYIGTDFSNRFLEITKKTAENIKLNNSNFEYELINIDITNLEEIKKLDTYKGFDLIVGIAVMHHVPGKELRKSITSFLKSLINSSGKIFLTSWNFTKTNSKLIVDPKLVGLEKSQLESNDYILTWKKLDYRYLCLLTSFSDLF